MKSIRVGITFDDGKSAVFFHSTTQAITFEGDSLYPSQLTLVAKLLRVIRSHEEGAYSRSVNRDMEAR